MAVATFNAMLAAACLARMASQHARSVVSRPKKVPLEAAGLLRTPTPGVAGASVVPQQSGWVAAQVWLSGLAVVAGAAAGQTKASQASGQQAQHARLRHFAWGL